MRLRTYFEPLPEHYAKEHHADVVDLWVETWTALGHDVKVLGRADAVQHPQYRNLVDKVRTWPTINPPPYTEACFVRWCAASVEAGDDYIAFMDYDVFPTTNLNYEVLQPAAVDYGDMPACVSGSGHHFDRVVDAFLDFTHPKLSGHSCDQIILRERGTMFKRNKTLRCYGVPNWRLSEMVHFANWTLSRDIPSRAGAIRSFMRNGLVDPELCKA